MFRSFLDRILPNPKPQEDSGVPVPPSDERLAAVRRRCWKPVVQEGDGAADDSKFSGSPALTAGETWPICPNCGNRMQLFVQLNSKDFPADAGAPWREGIAQLFYCTNAEPLCEVDCEAYFPFSRSTLVRILDTSAEIQTETPNEAAFPARRIVGWQELDDLPQAQEVGPEGLSEKELDALADAGYPRSGDKLFGWPAWIQGVEYPDCPECGTRMTLLFQIDSEDNVPYMLGDVGCGHITYCPEHPRVLAFGWACC